MKRKDSYSPARTENRGTIATPLSATSSKKQKSTNALDIAGELEELTGLETRVTILGHLQRGGTPSATDRLLATTLGSACIDFIEQGIFGVMVAAKGDGAVAVPLEDIVGKRHVVPVDHPWITAARRVNTCLGDE